MNNFVLFPEPNKLFQIKPSWKQTRQKLRYKINIQNLTGPKGLKQNLREFQIAAD